MATPTIPKKEKASNLLRARRLALKAARNASTKFGESLARSKASRLLGNTIKGNPNIPYPKGVNPAGNLTLANRALSPLGKSLLGRAGLAIQGFQTAKSVFDPNDNIITSARNVGRVARDQEALGNSELAKAYNKRRELKIDQSLEQLYKDAPMSDKTVPYPSLDQNAVPTENRDLTQVLTNNPDEGSTENAALEETAAKQNMDTTVVTTPKETPNRFKLTSSQAEWNKLDAKQLKELENRHGMMLKRGGLANKLRIAKFNLEPETVGDV